MSNETDEKVAEIKQQPRRGKTLIIAVFIVLFICVGAGVAGYFQLTRNNSLLALAVSDLQTQSTTQQNILSALQQSVDKLQASTETVQALSARQEQMIASWEAAQKGDLNKWYVAEAQYLVKLANDHVQFTQNTTMAMTLLQRADQVLQDLSDGNLLEIRKSLAVDIANLQAVPQVDVTQLYLRLTGLNAQVDLLPLPANPFRADMTQSAQKLDESGLSWWRKGLNNTWQALQKIVVVRNTQTTSLPIVLPEEKIFLYQNLHAQMEGAMWGVLHRDANVYQASLARAINWIKQYFVQDAPVTKALLQNLQDLQKVSLQVPAANFSATLQLFDAYLNPKAAQ